MTQLIPQQKIDEAANTETILTFGIDNNKQIDRGNFYNGFNAGVQFTLKEIESLMVEFTEWIDQSKYKRYTVYRNLDNTWIDENHEEFTTRQLLEEFIDFKNKV